ncbi:MAG: replication initiation protein [Treponema sp.]|jgi:plasmid replication initiation protein|nr:replication initiation protein [Treponema sp.]
MSKKQRTLEAVNTPETLGVTPRYVLQPNAISRSAHGLSATAKKLTAMAMALLPPDLSSLTAAFTFTEFCKALGMPIGGESYKIFRIAVDECMKCVITLETAPDKRGKKAWKKFTWFTMAEFDEKTGQAMMKFSTELADFLKELKTVYSKLYLQDIGRLQGRYAIRIFEMAISYAFLQGKQGNVTEKWYFQEEIERLRFMLGVPAGTYKETHLFRQKAIDGPVREINIAGIGVKITTEGVKQGRKLHSMRFNCEKTARMVGDKRRQGKKTRATVELPKTSSKQTIDAREDKENQHLRELYPAEFAELYQAELAKTPRFMPLESDLRRRAAEASAFESLRVKYGIMK